MSLPILCVDVLIRHRGRYLLIKRTEEPMRGVYWVIGGRVNKSETLLDAAIRKVREEIGLVVGSRDAEMVGIYEDRYEESSMGQVPGGYHTVAVVFEMFINNIEGLKLDGTSSDWGLFDDPPERFRVKRFEGDVYA